MAKLAHHARTPQARARLEEDPSCLFESSWSQAETRLLETAESRAILAAGDVPPIAGVREIENGLERLSKDGMLAGNELVALGRVLESTHETARFLGQRGDVAPGLADLGRSLVELHSLAEAIDRALDADGEVQDRASSALAAARREVRELSGSAKERVESMLRRPEIRELLQDDFYTVRGDRYVLPVRADFKGRMDGIIHDASSSGTTVFVEPQALVDLNNRLKQAELTVQRETRRVLAALSHQAAPRAAEITQNLETLGHIDMAFARGRLAEELDAQPPTLSADQSYDLPLLRHPLLPTDEAIPNDLRLGRDQSILVISGPNAGGKTVTMKAVALATLMARAGLQVATGPAPKIPLVDEVLADIGDEQDIRQSLSTFSAHMANLSKIVRDAGPKSLVVLDEIGVGTDPGEGAALAQAVLEALAERGAFVITTTHYNLLKEMADVDSRFANACVEFDAVSLAPTYRLKLGAPGSSSATAVASRMGMPSEVLERANALLEREDRQLDRLLSELSSHRASLETERAEATRLRQEGKAARDEYRTKLERLQERRDKLFDSMREELDGAFRQAHSEVADVIRELQRSGSAQGAAIARKRLLALEEVAKEKEGTQRKRTPVAEPIRNPMDWNHAKPGDPVIVPGGREATLISLPDRRGRVSVQAGAARMTVKAEQIEARPGKRPPKTTRPEHIQKPELPSAAGGSRLDVRGLRVDEALMRVEQALDDAARSGMPMVTIIHGVGGGALQSAIREHLARLPYVDRFEIGEGNEGGEGRTLAYLEPA